MLCVSPSGCLVITSRPPNSIWKGNLELLKQEIMTIWNNINSHCVFVPNKCLLKQNSYNFLSCITGHKKTFVAIRTAPLKGTENQQCRKIWLNLACSGRIHRACVSPSVFWIRGKPIEFFFASKVSVLFTHWKHYSIIRLNLHVLGLQIWFFLESVQRPIFRYTLHIT